MKICKNYRTYFNLTLNFQISEYYLFKNYHVPLPYADTREVYSNKKVMSQRLGVNYGYILYDCFNYYFETVFYTKINYESCWTIKIMIIWKHLPKTKMYDSIQRMLNFCALLPYTLLSFVLFSSFHLNLHRPAGDYAVPNIVVKL